MIDLSTDIRQALRKRQRGFILDPFRFGVAGGPPPTPLVWSSTDQQNTTLSDADLTITTSGWGEARSTSSRNSGKRQFNFRFNTNDIAMIGLALSTADITRYPGFDANAFGLYGNSGAMYTAGSPNVGGWAATLNLTDYFAFIFDFSNGLAKLYYTTGGSAGMQNGVTLTMTSFIGATLFVMGGSASSGGSRGLTIDGAPGTTYDGAIAWDAP